MANKQCKQDPWTQHTPWPYDPWQYQRWVCCMLMLFDICDNQEPVSHMWSLVAHSIAYNPDSWPLYWYFFLAVADIDKDKYVADSRFFTGWKVARNAKWNTQSIDVFRCCCTTPASSRRWARRGSMWAPARRSPSGKTQVARIKKRTVYLRALDTELNN